MKKIMLLCFVSLLLTTPARAEITAMQPNVKLGIGERPAVLFVKLHNKGAATRLVSAASSDFERIELHTHKKNPDGTMRMVKVDAFQVPANGMLALKRGGHHLMLFGFKGKKDDTVAVTLQFANGRAVTVTAAPSQRAKTGNKKMRHHGH